MEGSRSTQFRVGAFVVGALLVATIIAFGIGKDSNIFSKKAKFRTVFRDAGGLRQGNQVRIAGVNVGTVDKVDFDSKGRILVRFTVSEEARGLVRKGSKASIGSKGMLGDRLLEVSVGEGPRLPNGSFVMGEESSDLSSYMRKVGSILEDVSLTAKSLRTATEPLNTPEFGEDIRTTTHEFAKVASMAANGKGTVQKLLTDPKLAQSVDQTIQSLRQTSNDMQGVMKDVRAVVQEIRSGDGSAHDLIYGQGGKRLVNNLADATGEVAILLKDVRTKPGTVHDLIYEQKATALLENLTKASDDLKEITAKVRRGEGTVGRFLSDPSVYEDVKRLLGDLERNDILKALVRYSIRRDEARGGVKVQEKKR